jgi:cytochrome c556
MRSKFVAAACACVLLAACNWKAGQANSAQGNISQDNRPPATAPASAVTNSAATNGLASNAMVMLAVPLPRDRALQVMHVRHDGMEAIGDAFKTLHRALGASDIGSVRANAAKIAQLSQQASVWFPAGTGPNVGKTRAKAEIWQTADDFGAKLRGFQAAAAAMNNASRGNDAAAMNARFADLGGTCKACHDKYRAEEN